MEPKIYTDVTAILASGGMTDAGARLTLDRVLLLNGRTKESFDLAFARSIRANLEGAVFVRGDKALLPAVKRKLDELA
ncbi:MAG: hypothetical protein EXR75_04890 [Myxococcales bacterium]|nr:hypothetical protein [Myxococcales bacterium]